MRVIVTGSAGRLGRSIAQGLAADGHEVIGVDRIRRGLSDVDEREADLLAEGAAARLLRGTRPDAVIHLAGIAVPFSAPERRILEVNTTLAHAVFEAAMEAGVERTLAASSPTVLGYGTRGWQARSLPLDEEHPTAPANAYALSKVVIEELVRMHARLGRGAFGFFRPCFVLTPEEWVGAPTQQGHTVAERLADPALAAVSLFNYADARDVASFVSAWLDAPVDVVDGEGFFVGAADALARAPLARLWRDYAPGLGEQADGLVDDAPVFSIEKARRMLGWQPRRRWRDELRPPLAHAPHLPTSPATVPDRSGKPAAHHRSSLEDPS